jgi:hypothetical protein
VVHIYHDENGKYTGHSLYPERENKKEDWDGCLICCLIFG